MIAFLIQFTKTEKKARAEEIAKKLGDNNHWHTHGRSININKLREMKLEIEDYSKNNKLLPLIRSYNDLICDYISRMNFNNFLHSRVHF